MRDGVWDALPAFHDHDEPIEVAALGPRLRHALRAFELRYRGGCEHRDAEQLALVGDLRSACRACATASNALRAWESRGPCSSCGALLDAPPARVWLVPSERTGVVIAARICPRCAGTELRDPEPTETDEETP